MLVNTVIGSSIFGLPLLLTDRLGSAPWACLAGMTVVVAFYFLIQMAEQGDSCSTWAPVGPWP